ncbi:hypothetical protein JX265_011066 [Neoarthrinium moseri]|uniref:Sulphur transport domain-containing protein n=1 Tax=Neoarthrinium moseri TaxID=1658444 RepID=A0A9Q0AHU5_9PEZI|nr:hypothetical protein JX265_011066 [Neoarthrinium moseri]
MALNMFTTVLCGSAFGAALTASGVHQPGVIVSQFTLENFHMVESFLAAAASSVALVTLFQRLGYVQLPPRSRSSIGLFGNLDGNIVGGLVLGTGMALSGSCPGTVFAQVGAGIRSGFYALAGGIVGGILWTGVIRPLLPKPAANDDRTPAPLAIDEKLGISKLGAVVALEAIFVAILATTIRTSAAKTQGLVEPVAGGLLIGAAQLLTVVSRKTLLGTSTAFEEVGTWFWSVIKGAKTSASTSFRNVVFVLGVVLGARLLSTQGPVSVGHDVVALDHTKVLLGGILMSIGSRMAGGCTSGHGISGISLLSVSSFVTVAAMFAGAIGTGLALY